MAKLSRNAQCPCGSGLKFKYCCQGKVPWIGEYERGSSVDPRWLSGRVKHLMFMGAMADALKLDTGASNFRRSDLKRAFTPEAIRKVYLASAQLWPDLSDLKRVLSKEADHTSMAAHEEDQAPGFFPIRMMFSAAS